MPDSGVTIGSTGSAAGLRLRSWRPIAALRPFVDHFAILDASLENKSIYDPLPARNDCFLEFFLEGHLLVANVESGAIHAAPRRVLVGPQTKRREDIVLAGTLKVFHIGFTPTGFHSLFGIPTRLMCNLAESAEAVVGRSINELELRLASAPELHWGAIAERFLMRNLLTSKTTSSGNLAAVIARSLSSRRNPPPVSDLARMYGKSTRQVERIFEGQIGLSPKLFARVARLRSALELSARMTVPDWSSVAIDAGYFDQSHMIRDFRSLTGETPAGFKRLQANLLAPDLRTHVAFVQSSFAPIDLK
jgi:AraC-like DNA-binding protein